MATENPLTFNQEKIMEEIESLKRKNADQRRYIELLEKKKPARIRAKP